jgi:gluconolactonase
MKFSAFQVGFFSVATLVCSILGSAGEANPPVAGVPQGTTKEFTFNESAIFPGTVRKGTVFIPAQYDGKTPACVYVRQDGFNGKEKTMLEQLIAAKEMPVTIGVFVTPGQVPAPMPGTVGRRNRCFEYDGVGDAHARFIVEEILPYVAKQFELKLSNSGNDRCIAGGSSGGISAFNAAWERPDLFTRVFCASGSFVAFRGGHEFPTLIRKTETKPIRAYFTTGTHDMENCAGDWYLIDQEIDKALKFSGYEYFYKSIEGGHVVGWNENFADAMRYIWKGWPEPVAPGKNAPRVRDVLGAEPAKWELVSENCKSARGPACNSKGEVFFVDAEKIYRIGLEGNVREFAGDAADGLSVGAKDEVYAVSHSSGKVMSYDAAGKGSAVGDVAGGLYICARPDGSLYVTTESGNIVLLKDGRKTEFVSNTRSAAGIAYRPDQWLLSVADRRSKWVFSYQIKPDGTLVNGERFFWLHVADWDDDAGAESVCYAKEGQMFVATRMGIQVCADDGPTQVILPMPDRSRVFGVCLGGADGDMLFAFCGIKIWKRKIKLHANGAFSPWVGVKGSPL